MDLDEQTGNKSPVFMLETNNTKIFFCMQQNNRQQLVSTPQLYKTLNKPIVRQ